MATDPSSPHRPPNEQEPNELWKYATLGIEFIAAVAICVFVGLWIDRLRHSRGPWFTLIGLAVGFAAGLYRLILAAFRRGGRR